MAELRMCMNEECDKKLARSNTGMLCYACSQEAQDRRFEGEQRKAMTRESTPVMCARGCGLPVHRGRCKGSSTVARVIVRAALRPDVELPAPVEVVTKEKRKTMDKLVAEMIDVAGVPVEAETPAPIRGRAGELWVRFQELPVGKALAVECRDSSHLGCTNRDLRKKAEAAGFKVRSSRKDMTYFCWKEQAA